MYFDNPIIENGWGDNMRLSAMLLTVWKLKKSKKLKKYKPSVNDYKTGYISVLNLSAYSMDIRATATII